VTNEQQATDSPPRPLRAIAADALRFWEWGRVFYNSVLLAIVAVYFVAGLPGSWRSLSLNLLLFIFVMAVVANVLYSLAYVADVFVQLAGLRPAWGRWRWLLLLIGTTTAGIITRFFSMGMFSHGHID
jgi:hypothetical protein